MRDPADETAGPNDEPHDEPQGRPDRAQNTGSSPDEDASSGATGGGPQPSPDLIEALHQIRDAARASLDAAGDTGKALRSLLLADFSLARSALGRALAMTGVAIVFGGSAWLLLLTALVVFLGRELAWPWWVALLACAALSLIGTAVAVFAGMRYFAHTRMRATRRQLARLGIGEPAESGPRAGSAESSRAGSERMDRSAKNSPRKDSAGIDVTLP